MKARRKDSNDDWQEIAYILLENSRFPQSADLMEFEQETTGGTKYLPNYIYDHWQEVRERAAIAAMQGFLSRQTYRNGLTTLAKDSVRLANCLIEELKKRN